VCIIGTSAGLVEEIDIIRRYKALEKTVLLAPPCADPTELWRSFSERCPGLLELPEENLNSTLRAITFPFDDNSPKLHECRSFGVEEAKNLFAELEIGSKGEYRI